MSDEQFEPISILRAPFAESQLPPLNSSYDVELQFRGELVDSADHYRVKLKSGEIIAPPRTVLTQRQSEGSGLGKTYTYASFRLRNVQLIAVTSNDLGNVERFQFSDGTKVSAEWLSGISFFRSIDG